MLKRYGFICALLLAVPAWAANVGSLVADLSSDDENVRHAAYSGITAGDFGADAIAPVAKLLDHENQSVTRAAKLALERIAGALSKDTASREAAGLALCEAARNTGSRDGRHWLLWLVSYTGEANVVPVLDALLDNPDSFDSALLALRGVGGSAASDALVKRLARANDEQRIAYINALAVTGGASAATALMDAATRDDDAGLAALQGLARLGYAKGAELARDRYAEQHEATALSAYVRIAEAQNAKQAARLFAKLLSLKNDPKAVCAGLTGLGQTGKPRDVKKLLPHLDSERADVHGAAVRALITLDGASADKAIRSALNRATPGQEKALLEALYRRNVSMAVPALEAALERDTAEVRATALRLLGDTLDSKYEGTFLDSARTGAEVEKPVALESYLQLGDAAFGNGEQQKALSMYHTALDLAMRNEEREHALSGMTKIASPESLTYLETHVENRALQKAIGTCAMKIALNIEDSDPETAKMLYERIAAEVSSLELATRARDNLRAMGVDMPFAKRAGFIMNWELIGPFPKTGFDAVFPPERGYDPKGRYAGAEDLTVAWNMETTDSVRGIFELNRFFQPNESVIAYGRAVVTVPEARDATLLMGSDDGIMCWVNGELIHINNTDRKVHVDEDSQNIQLRAGKNVIMVKIVQGGGGWGFCARLVDAAGKPIAFEN